MTNFFWRSNDDRFIDRFAQKRLTDGRLIANVLIVEDIERTDDLVDDFAILFFVIERHRSPEKYAVAAWRRRIDDLHVAKALVEKSHPSIDFSQSPFSIDIFGIFASVALRRRFCDFVDDFRAFDALEMLELVFE